MHGGVHSDGFVPPGAKVLVCMRCRNVHGYGFVHRVCAWVLHGCRGAARCVGTEQDVRGWGAPSKLAVSLEMLCWGAGAPEPLRPVSINLLLFSCCCCSLSRGTKKLFPGQLEVLGSGHLLTLHPAAPDMAVPKPVAQCPVHTLSP